MFQMVAGRSGRARADAARMLMEDVDGGREYADRLAKCWDPKVRILAAPYADPHLFLDETDPDVVGAVIKGGLADDVCRERWTSPDKPFGVRLAAGALVTDGKEADHMLAVMDPDERVRFLGTYPRLAVGKRAVGACRVGGDEPLLEYSMTRVPDGYLREALESESGHWGLNPASRTTGRRCARPCGWSGCSPVPTVRCSPRSANRSRPKSPRRRSQLPRRQASRLGRGRGSRDSPLREAIAGAPSIMGG